MWVELWSAKHQRPYFYNKQTKQTVWKGHRTTATAYDEFVVAKSRRVETPLLSVREHNRFVKANIMHDARILATGQWDAVQELKALGMSPSLLSLAAKPRLRVLDVGCGDGSDLRRWTFDDDAKWVAQVHGFDVSPKCIEAAQQNTAEWQQILGFPRDVEIRYATHDARKKGAWRDVFADKQPLYDIVSCMHCLPYFFSSHTVAKPRPRLQG